MKLIASLTAAAAAALTLSGGVAVAQDRSGAALVDFVFSEVEREFGLSPASRQAGRLAASGTMTGTFNVAPNANYIAIGACDENCADLDLVIRDASGNEVGSDYEPDDAPMVVIPAGSGGRYTFEVIMATCSSNCNWGVRSYNAGS
jgi:hypothetical protein